MQAFTQGDPLGWVVRDRDGLTEVATNLTGEYAHRACCVLGVRGSLMRDNREAAAAITEAILEAQEFVAANPDEAAAIFAPYSPVAKPDQLAAMLRSHTHNHHPIGADLRQEIAAYVEELKAISVIKPSHQCREVLRQGVRQCSRLKSGDLRKIAGRSIAVPVPEILAPLVPFWTAGAIAGGGWLAAAAVTHLLPDIDDFERTGLLTYVMAGLGLTFIVIAGGCRATHRSGTGTRTRTSARGSSCWQPP